MHGTRQLSKDCSDVGTGVKNVQTCRITSELGTRSATINIATHAEAGHMVYGCLIDRMFGIET